MRARDTAATALVIISPLPRRWALHRRLLYREWVYNVPASRYPHLPCNQADRRTTPARRCLVGWAGQAPRLLYPVLGRGVEERYSSRSIKPMSRRDLAP